MLQQAKDGSLQIAERLIMEWKGPMALMLLAAAASGRATVRHLDVEKQASVVAAEHAKEAMSVPVVTAHSTRILPPRVVDRQGQPLPDAELSALARRSEVVEACLVCTGITDRAIRPLASMPSLKTLDLRGNPLTDAAVEWLVGCPSLRLLDVRGTRMTAEGVRRLNAFRPKIQVLWCDASRD